MLSQSQLADIRRNQKRAVMEREIGHLRAENKRLREALESAPNPYFDPRWSLAVDLTQLSREWFDGPRAVALKGGQS